MQTENLTYNSHKQFYVLLNTNQIRHYTYPHLLKENPLLKKFLNSKSTAYSLDTHNTFLKGSFCRNSY